MKRKNGRWIFSALLALAILICLIPASAITVRAGHACPNCDDWIDGSPYCENCNECAECCDFCYECGICSDCSGWEICDENCGENGDICVDCALDQGHHCPDCYECYLKEGLWCDECGRCNSCVDTCYDCSIYLGVGGICVECAMDEGTHCPDCGGCHGPVQWCQVCGLCEDCSAICVYCTEETGEYICEACAIDDGLHCPDCQECYGESNWEYCSECGICANCVEYCDAYELCLNCAVENGYHCPSCEGCCENEPICESCGEACRECADDFCESCGMCSNCVQVCPSCGACSNCAEICPNCGEYCSDCEDICDDCEFCLVCCQDIAAFEGCDCADWVCVESGDWKEHMDEAHTYTSQEGHTARAVKSWSWDENWHWQACVYCDDSDHYSNKFAHAYDKNGMCIVCNYAKNSNIQILKQPVDVKNVKVRSPYENYDNSNIAHFSVKAVGKSELTYTWYTRRYTGPSQWDYVPLKDPEWGEKYTGPDLYVLASTDACCTPQYYMCIIVDAEGNQARTVEVMLQGQHNYQYFKYYDGDYPSDPYETAAAATNYHNLQCVGEGCEKTVSVRPHVDENDDDECDICRKEMPAILITEQPKADRNVMVSSSDEDPLENNYAKYSVKAEGNSELTYTWCRRVYTAPSVFHYEPLTNPRDGEVFDGPDARILAPEDACTNTYVYRCIITDKEGNTAETIDVVMEAKHNYQYYKYYISQTGKYPEASRRETCHKAVCVGNDCGKVSRLSQHVDVDKDFQCDICYYINFIDELTLTAIAPVSGEKPDYNMSVDISACYIRGTGIDRTYRRWYESDNGVSGWRLMSPTDTFVGGKYYKFEVDVATISGREFSTYASQTTSHTVWLWTFDKRGKLLQTGSLPHKNYATLTLENPYYCQPKQIQNIVIEGLDEPVTGQKPDYNVTLGGSGYKLDSGATSTRKNGIMWKQYGASDGLPTDSKFMAAKTYTCYITLVAEENYAFDPSAIATINGKTATCELYNDNKTAVLSYEYTQIPPARIKEVNLTGIQRPWAGEEVDWQVTLDSDLYYVDEFGWGDLTLNEAHFGEFVRGHQYEFGIMLVTEMIGGDFQCEFDDNVVVTVNGRPATVIDVGWDGYSGSYVYFTYLCQPTGENVKLTKQPTSVTVNKGEKATVTVVATGTDLTYTWYYKNKDASKFSKTTSFTGPTYTVDMNESRDGRQVYCEVRDGKGNCVATNVATLGMTHQHIYDQKVVKAEYKVSSATCTKKATYYKSCTCGKAGKETFETGDKKAHNYTTTTTKATLSKDGSIVKKCTACGNVASTTTIKYAKTFSLSATSYTYDGKVKTPSVTVKDASGKTLTKDVDYAVTYASGRKSVGTYKVTITMKGNYSGTKTLTFKIKPIDISKCTIKLSATSYTYDGKVKTPSVTVKNANGTTLKKDTHYTVSYASGRKSPGTYKVTITMKGNYSGTKTLTFKIKPIDISKCTIKLSATSYTYDGKVKTPSVTVKNANGTTLKKDTHYTVSYASGRKSLGTYKVTITMKGNYSGAKTLTFEIGLATPKVSVANVSTGVKVTWNQISGAKKYTVYRSTYSNGKWSDWKAIKSGVTGTSYTDTTVKSGATVRYRVRAINGDFKSDVKTGSTIKYLAQPKVTAAKVSGGIKASWEKITGASGYIVYRRTYSNGKWGSWEKIKTTTALNYTDKTAKKGVTYQYTVRAYNGDYKSSYTNSKSIKR